jgi:UDP-N-acetylglucosamine 2-epimerase (non-hydrolysing)
MKRVVTVLGTRPEAIKLAPVHARLRADRELDARLVVTGQHREIADEVLRAFDLAPDADLDLMRPGQSLGALTGRALAQLEPLLDDLRPDMLVVQGDTTTAFAASLASFYARVPVAHVEAGLRTGDLANPFPEEANRRLTGVIAQLHLAPTPWAKANLIAERVPERSIVVTGNTIVDALETLTARPHRVKAPGLSALLRASRERPLVVVTTHRRENWGAPQQRIARAVRRAALAYPGARFLVPLHPNPAVRASLLPELSGLDNVVLSEPLGYADMLRALKHAHLAVTDSGGIQEEGCVLGVPVICLRDVTERPEGVLAGVVRIAGTEEDAVFAEIGALLSDPDARARMARASGVFGDGLASMRTQFAIKRFFGLETPEFGEFSPAEIESLSFA